MKTIGHTLPPHPGRGSAQRRFRHHGAWCRLAGWLLLGISGMGTAAASPDGVGQYITDAAEIRRQVEREVERLVDEQLTPADQYLNQLTQAVSTRFPLHEVGTRVQVRVSYNPSRMFVADGILRRVDTDGAGIGCIYYLAADIAWEDWCRLNPDCNWRARERAMNRDSQQYLRQREELAARIRSQRLPQAMAEKGYSFDRRTRTWQPPATAAPDDAGIQPVAGSSSARARAPSLVSSSRPSELQSSLPV